MTGSDYLALFLGFAQEHAVLLGAFLGLTVGIRLVSFTIQQLISGVRTFE